MDRFLNQVKGYAQAQAAALGQPRVGIVTSYNPNDHTAKVTIQPENTTTGWLPVASSSVGSGWGLHIPLQTGEQVVVMPQDGSADSGIIMGRMFSDKMRPPNPNGSDAIMRSNKGGIVDFHADGSVEVKDAAGVSFKLTNDGNVHLTAPNTIFFQCQSFNVQASVNVTLQAPITNVSNELDVGTGPIKQNGVTVIVP